MSHPLLHIHQISIGFQTDNGFRETLQQIDFQLYKNEILGIVGESGSGKSLTSLAVLGLLPSSAKITEGEILYNGDDLSTLSTKQLRKIRGKEISMIFQEPMSSLNPSMKCGPQVTEILLEHTALSKKEAIAETLQLFEKVKLPRPESIYDVYPHQISGGQKQRVMIAMAIACKPKILIADEPTTALDVTVQKEILLLLKSLQQETEMSIIFISHDLALVSEISDRVVVMYQGKIVEQGPKQEILTPPHEDYTALLLSSVPEMDPDWLDNLMDKRRAGQVPTSGSL